MRKNLTAVIVLLSTCISCNTFPARDVRNITKDGQKIIDSGINAINKRYEPYKYADSLINVDHTLLSLKIIDSLIKLHPFDAFLCTCKGDWYFKNKLYDKALNTYDQAASVARNESPLILDKKANAYIKLNKLAEAISSYRKAAAINEDFYQHVATVFELKNEKDSAIKYYNYYLSTHAEDSQIKSHVDSLSVILKKSE